MSRYYLNIRRKNMLFNKMHGLGNDFVVVQVEDSLPRAVSQLAVNVCDRHMGIGADGLVFITPSDHADVGMRIFNADGTEAEQCGNAVRCVAKYYYERIDKSSTLLTVETRRGIQPLTLQVVEDLVVSVRVDMGEPILEPSQIPVQSPTNQHQIEVDGTNYMFTAVSMGNPHAVIEVEDVASFPIHGPGPCIETDVLFPERVNVEFITIHSPSEISLRVWERGVGETMACGSGACAVLVASHLNGKADRKATVHLLGGDLEIHWDERDNHVYMTGPATFVFTGVYFSEKIK
jgi:diaminopimelate epimerase